MWLLYVAAVFDCGGHGQNKLSIIGADWLAYMANIRAYLPPCHPTKYYYLIKESPKAIRTHTLREYIFCTLKLQS